MRQVRIPHPRTNGFTLIELMVVIVLIGIAAALLIPEMKGSYEDAVLRSTARKLADACAAANSQAIAASEVHRLRIDTTAGRYFVESNRRTRENAATAVDLPGGSGELAKQVSIEVIKPEESDETVTPDQPKSARHGEVIAFYPDGTADGDEVLIRDRQGFRVLLRINPITARVHVVDLERQ